MKNYIVKTKNKEYDFKSLKEARIFIRSLLNVDEIKGVEESYELYKEVVSRKKIDEVKSNPKNIGKFDSFF
jgi:hypothetical protein